jgi:DNA-binding transcriptional regulator YdaS (Cro superfamily)
VKPSGKQVDRDGGVNRVWFVDRLASRNISQRKLAGLMDMDASAVSLMLSGKRKMSAQEAGDVARLLGVTVDEVLRHAGIAVPVNVEKSVPVVGYVDDRMEVRFGRAKGPQTSVAPPDCGKGCQALRVQAAGMMEGWLVFYFPTEGVSLEAVGRLCVVKVVGEDAQRLKLVARGYEAGYHVLSSLRGGEPLHVRLESAAPVVWLKQ